MIYKLKNGDRISSGSIEKNIIEVRLSENFTKTTNASEKIPFDKVFRKVGVGLSLVDGKVVIGKGIRYVKISGQISITNTSTASKLTIQLRKNTTGTISENLMYSNQPYTQVHAIPRLIDVKENDTIEMLVNSAIGDILPANSNVYLMVEAIE